MKRLVLALLLALPATAALYPSDANVLDVTKAPFNAPRGTCPSFGTDATTAIRAAIAAAGLGQIVYLPAGCYTITKTLWWSAAGTPDPPTSGNGALHFVQIQGASESTTILKVPNSTAYFGSASGCANGTYAGYNVQVGGTGCRAVIYTTSSFNSSAAGPTYGFGNDAYMDNIIDLSIQIGTGNPGAIGIDATGSNTTAIRNVNITDLGGGSNALIGLSLSRTQSGPAYVQNLTVSGFKTGILSGSPLGTFAAVWNSWTMEHLNLSGQGTVGWYNVNQPMMVNGLISTNTVPAVANNVTGRITLINASLTGGSSSVSAIQANGNGSPATQQGVLFLRNISCSGYVSCLNNNGSVIGGNSITEYPSKPVQNQYTSINTSLNEASPDAPTFVDTNFAADWANVTSATYGSCVPNTSFDCTTAIQAAFNSGKPVIYFPYPANSNQGANNTYRLDGTISVPSTVRLVEFMGSCITAHGTSNCLSQTGGFANEHTPFTCPGSCNVIFENAAMDKTTTGQWTFTGTGSMTLRDLFNPTNFAQTCTTCTTYFEDSAVTGVTINGGTFLCRQCDIETSGNHILYTANATGWMLGFKIEGNTQTGSCTLTTCAILNVQNSTVEVLGSFFQSNSNGTAFLMSGNSQVSIANPSTFGTVYTNDFTESRNGSMFKTLNDTSFFNSSIGSALYSGNTIAFNPMPPPTQGCVSPTVPPTIPQCGAVLTPGGGSSASSISLAFQAAVQAHDTRVIAIGYFNSSPIADADITAVDVNGNPLTCLPQQLLTTGGNTISIKPCYLCDTAGGADTLTGVFSHLGVPINVGFPVAQIFEIKGVDQSSCLNASSSAASTTNTPTSGSATTSTASLVINVINSEVMPTACNGTSIQNPSGQVAAACYTQQSMAGAITSTWTIPMAPFVSVVYQLAFSPAASTPSEGMVITQ